MNFALQHPLPYGLDEASRSADFWPTPRHAVESILEICPPPPGRVLEPAAGDGAIVRVLIERGYEVHAMDIRPEVMRHYAGLCPITIGDWIAHANSPITVSRIAGGHPESILTNPPFSIGRQFAQACLTTRPAYLALLLRCNVIGSNPWAPFWLEHPPTGLYPLRQRPSFSGDGKTDASEYAWITWEQYKAPVTLRPI